MLIYTLGLLGETVSCTPMVEHFLSQNGYFVTYVGERIVSFSANCHVLDALFLDPEVDKYEALISSTAAFLCESWWTGVFPDKWVHLNFLIS